ncbi:MAG: gamma-glutamyltransferase [Alphaproteobacteria bacterium]|nr:gamma-glutamyltransferase [Alphaproteobacteria bacterium]
MVAAQHHLAAKAGADILAAGGNAVDAGVATALAIGGVEPWNSGIGGCGCMLVYVAAERRTHVVDFLTLAPKRLDPGRYPLTNRAAADNALFVWPTVAEERNRLGPEAIGVPGSIAGLALALERFGTMPWRDVIQPAIRIADAGLPVDWYTLLQIVAGGAELGNYPTSRETYLHGGLPPVANFAHAIPRLPLGRLADTLRRLADAGPADFYTGDIARSIVSDIQAAGGVLSLDDLASYRAAIVEPLAVEYRGATVHLIPGFTGGPTFARALRTLAMTLNPRQGLGAAAYQAYAEALSEAYQFRFEHLGHDGDPQLLGTTTHLSVVDEAGNMVTLTNTLLERFGSRVMLPGTGIMMNNGIMWFDPRPGRANSMAPGKRPLSNMCPVIATREGAGWFALGASGGRRIVPATFQLASFLIDFGLDLDAAYGTPRIDASGGDSVFCDRRLPPDVIEALKARMPVTLTENTVHPKMFANPQTVLRVDGRNSAAVTIHSPTAAVAVAGEA